MDIENVTGLWTRISDHLEKNHTKIGVSRNEPFSGHLFSFSKTCESINFSIRSLSVFHRPEKTIRKEGKELAKQKPDFREGRPKKFNQQQINLAMNLLESHSYKEVEKMTGISKSTMTHHKRKQIVMTQ